MFQSELSKLNQLKTQEIFSFRVGDFFTKKVVIQFSLKFGKLFNLLISKGIKVEYGHGYYFDRCYYKLFFQCLNEFQNRNKKLILSESNLEKNMKKLQLAEEEIKQFRSMMRYGYTFKEYKKEAKKQQDPSKCLALAIFHSRDKQMTEDVNYWLHFVNVDVIPDDFFQHFETIAYPWIFTLSKSFLDKLIQKSKIHSIALNDLSSPHHNECIQGLKYFLENSNKIQKIALSSQFEEHPIEDCLIIPIFDSLKINTSLTRISISRLKSKTIGSHLILRINENQKSSISMVTIFESTIDDETAKSIVELMKTRHVRVNIKYCEINDQIQNEIELLNLKLNK